MARTRTPPILARKNPAEPSVFEPANLLREARRQRGLPGGTVPRVCVLDPDGDIVRHLVKSGQAEADPTWACYHSTLHRFTLEGMEMGVVGHAVGAPFAVLVGEEMFASGCGLIISMTSSGRILPVREPPYFVLIEKSLRDEGTSYHYAEAAAYSAIGDGLSGLLDGAFAGTGVAVERGATWTTDAPFRETATAIAYCEREGILAVEMEAAALYAFARARGKPVIAFAHVTNRMGTIENDFEKGDAMGSRAALAVISATARRWLGSVASGGATDGKAP